MTVTEYVRNKSIRQHATYCILAGTAREVFIYEGETFTPAEFEERFPLPPRLNEKENYDKSRKWMYH